MSLLPIVAVTGFVPTTCLVTGRRYPSKCSTGVRPMFAGRKQESGVGVGDDPLGCGAMTELGLADLERLLGTLEDRVTASWSGATSDEKAARFGSLLAYLRGAVDALVELGLVENSEGHAVLAEARERIARPFVEAGHLTPFSTQVNASSSGTGIRMSEPPSA